MSAFGQVVRNEARLVRRQPTNMIGSIGLPVVLMIIFGELPSSTSPCRRYGGLILFDTYVPIIMVLGLTMLTLLGLPGPLVSYRELGILRRLSTTPVPPSWLLAAQVVVQLCIALAGLAIVNIASVAAFGAPVPKSPGGLALSCLLAIGGLFALGLLIAALAPTANSVNAIGTAGPHPAAVLRRPVAAAAAHAGRPAGHQQLHAARRGGGGDPGLRADRLPPGHAAAGPGRDTPWSSPTSRAASSAGNRSPLRAGAAPAQVVTPGPGRLRVYQQPALAGPYSRQARTAWTSSPARLSSMSCRMWLTT